MLLVLACSKELVLAGCRAWSRKCCEWFFSLPSLPGAAQLFFMAAPCLAALVTLAMPERMAAAQPLVEVSYSFPRAWLQSPTAEAMEAPREASTPTASSVVIGHLPSLQFALSLSKVLDTAKMPLKVPLASPTHLPKSFLSPRTSPFHLGSATLPHLFVMVAADAVRPATSLTIRSAAMAQSPFASLTALHDVTTPATEAAR